MSVDIQLQARSRSSVKHSSSFTPAPIGLLQRQCACGGSPGVDGECEECRKKRLSLQRHATNQAGPATAPPIVHEVLRSAGQPLDAATRAFMEPRFRHDFSRVRVHTDEKATQSARSVNALAYTVGNSVVFGTGQYAPGTMEGKRLLAHELTHTIQQDVGFQQVPHKLEITDPGNVVEQEATVSEKVIEQGYPFISTSGRQLHIARQVIQPQGQPQGPQSSCGPDVTEWFVSLMNTAKTDPRVLLIRRLLSMASIAGSLGGYRSMDVLEGGEAALVRTAAIRAGKMDLLGRTENVTAARQLASADPHGQFGSAAVSATAISTPIGAFSSEMFLLLAMAGEQWKRLVETNAVWDFKSNTLSRANLARASCAALCPDPPTITLCNTCYENNIPGDLFYAYIGTFCGFSRIALQLGSQYAELQPSSTRNWDPPQDTAAIDLGLSLPSTITRTNLYFALGGAVGSLVIRRECPICSTAYP
jgi:hypothetical protein